MADDRILAAGKKRGKLTRQRRWRGVAHSVDALIGEVQTSLAHAVSNRTAADPAREELAGGDVVRLTARQRRDHLVRELKNVVLVLFWPPSMTFSLAWIKTVVIAVPIGTRTTFLTLIDARHAAKCHPEAPARSQTAP
ncbi:MAG: hypothetical protein JO179_18405, partial [Solirubrobacterales bacterium]|nr:hypothetical protein [Solirubrobacterales bacterium]